MNMVLSKSTNPNEFSAALTALPAERGDTPGRILFRLFESKVLKI